mmetsp:Transcript_92047/g.234045  ORF Transcript_92047/g.234045 Transcript_92047/m.234045 type:complete len:294 (+) Transcript_92047:841-1722(+)
MVEIAEGLVVASQVLRGHVQVALGRGFLLTSSGQACLRLRHLLVSELDLILQALLHSLEGVEVRGLLFAGGVELALGPLEQVRESVNNVAAVALVDGTRRGADILIVRGALHEGGELAGVGGAEHGGLHQGVQSLRQVLRALQLQHGGAALLHLPLQDADGALQRADDLRELLLRCREGRLLLRADVRGGLQVGLVHGDLTSELLDLGTQGAHGRLLLGDRGLEPFDLSLAGLDLMRKVLGALLAPFRVLGVHLLRILTLLDDLGLEVAQELQDLAHGRGELPDDRNREGRRQ